METSEREAVLPKDWSLGQFILWTMTGGPRLSLSPRQRLGMKLVPGLWDYCTFYLIKDEKTGNARLSSYRKHP